MNCTVGNMPQSCAQGADGRGAVVALTAAITEASAYEALEAEVETATALRERWERRAEAVAQLDSVVAAVRSALHSASSYLPTSASVRCQPCDCCTKQPHLLLHCKEEHARRSRCRRTA